MLVYVCYTHQLQKHQVEGLNLRRGWVTPACVPLSCGEQQQQPPVRLLLPAASQGSPHAWPAATRAIQFLLVFTCCQGLARHFSMSAEPVTLQMIDEQTREKSLSVGYLNVSGLAGPMYLLHLASELVPHFLLSIACSDGFRLLLCLVASNILGQFTSLLCCFLCLLFLKHQPTHSTTRINSRLKQCNSTVSHSENCARCLASSRMFKMSTYRVV